MKWFNDWSDPGDKPLTKAELDYIHKKEEEDKKATLTNAILDAVKAQIWTINITNPEGKTVFTLRLNESKYFDAIEVFGISPQDSLTAVLVQEIKGALKKANFGVKK